MRRHVLWVLGLVLVLTGAAAGTGLRYFVFSEQHLVGVVISGLGLLVLAAGLGYLLGRRRRHVPRWREG